MIPQTILFSWQATHEIKNILATESERVFLINVFLYTL